MPQGSLLSLYQKYRLQDSQVSVYTRQILNGLKYLHDRNVVHRWELIAILQSLFVEMRFLLLHHLLSHIIIQGQSPAHVVHGELGIPCTSSCGAHLWMGLFGFGRSGCALPMYTKLGSAWSYLPLDEPPTSSITLYLKKNKNQSNGLVHFLWVQTCGIGVIQGCPWVDPSDWSSGGPMIMWTLKK